MSQQEEIKSSPRLHIPVKELLTWKNVGRSVHSVLDGTFLTTGRFRRAMPFILFLMILGILYISNIFRVEKTKRQIDNLEEDLRELRYEYITSRSKLMDESKPSEIVIKLKDTGIGESMDPPTKVMISEEAKTDKP
jgi:hypothetical protein